MAFYLALSIIEMCGSFVNSNFFLNFYFVSFSNSSISLTMSIFCPGRTKMFIYDKI